MVFRRMLEAFRHIKSQEHSTRKKWDLLRRTVKEPCG